MFTLSRDNHYTWSHIILIISIIGGALLGGFSGTAAIVMLAALEISLSFDNAVVNAKILQTMTPFWRKAFIKYGIPIAVFGMRFLFPIAIVAVAADLTMFQTFTMAVNDPVAYQGALESNKMGIFAFGGAFLLMVFLGFFFDGDREEKWVKVLEDHPATKKISSIDNIELMIAVMTGLILVAITDSSTVAVAFFGGVLLHTAISALDGILSTNGVRSGIAGFLYLEVLDASFSFDGVIGAFAISNNIFIIMVGLGIGAMYVRAMTLHFVEKGTLATYKYLEHGAHYAIGALAMLMFMKMFFHIPEMIVGFIGVGLLVLAYVHSVRENNKTTQQ